MVSARLTANSLRLCAACLICCLSLNLCRFCGECGALRSSFLRLHVIANSDSEADQAVKLAVRDAVLREGRTLFDGSVTAETARARIEPHIAELERAAEEVVRAHGKTDRVCITVGQAYFPARTYDGYTLPAGVYEAVRVVVGDGGGRNWWCVMFPPLCLPAAGRLEPDDLLTKEQTDILKEPEHYTVKLKLVEWVEALKQKLDGEKQDAEK